MDGSQGAIVKLSKRVVLRIILRQTWEWSNFIVGRPKVQRSKPTKMQSTGRQDLFPFRYKS